MADKIEHRLIKTDLYDAVNGDWLKTATIPSDHSTTGGFTDLSDNIEKTLMADFKALLTGHLATENDEMNEFKQFYELVSDFDKRDKDGSAPLKPYLERIEALNNYQDLSDQLADWILTGLPTPFSLDIDSDMKNSTKYALFASGPRLFLPDKTYYEDDNQAAKQLMPVLEKMMTQLFELAGYDAATTKTIIQQATAFDKLIAPHVKSAEESADYSKMYNPRTLDQIADSTDQLDLKTAISALVHGTPEKIITTEPDFFDALGDLLTDDHFQMMKSWMLFKAVMGLSSYLSDEQRQASTIYSRAMSGRKEARSQEKSAYDLATGVFDQVVGDYYGRKYFGETAKQDVHDMVVKMVNVYKKRLANNTWLGKATREKAILKLDKLGIQVGFPDKIDPLYSKFKVTSASQGGSVLSNLMTFTRIRNEDDFARWNQPVDRSRWEMSASTVNAYFHPFYNIIVFPAAILQAPFYSLKQSSSENFGGIGAVIAHEISHAFDNNGSLFDENGSLNNWWTDADNQHFHELAENMVKEFDGLPYAGQTVNGKLTVSENIADAGGLSCALEAAKAEPDVDLNAFFLNWAKIWRQKATPEREQLLLSIDVHAPAKLRANVQVQNLDDFFSTFNVQPGDKMYKAPADRVKIW
ncbi:M13 family metallopeptidase [Secundilactobacillus mixtipabuli]|uniref:Endopeptidase n=1 Tax=Secundilactobacillus mixtipabuli TaxID=1435342 RepID=A0A1Z5IB10_9LACO|nr:M13-type metalloendopeptidase [Secundilactobacillus mixtipabuli]GAW98932.1 endopeptidase [Secundilactobacillus mixtipabuli]